MERIIGTAVVGMGGRGKYFAQMYSKHGHPGFELRAVCDRDEKKLAGLHKLYGDKVAYYSDVDELVKDTKIDAVLVTTNDPDHVAPTVSALRAGKNVLVEKPLCQSIEDAQTIMREARRAKGMFMIGLELRDCTVFQTMKRLLNEGKIGDVKVGHAFDNVSVGGRYFFHGPHRQKAFFKSLLIQKACHSIDLLNWFMDSEPVRVYGIGGQVFYGRKEEPTLRCRNCEKAETCPYFVKKTLRLDYDAVVEINDFCVWGKQMDLDDHALLAITYANDAKATFQECHFTPEYTREFWLIGTEGKMYGYYDNPGRFLVRIEYSHDPDRRTEEWKPPHTGGSHGGGDDRLRDEFYRRIVENDPPLEATASAYYSTALAICGTDSIESGMPVDIPPLIED